MSLLASRSRANHHLDATSYARLQHLVQSISKSSQPEDYLAYLNWHIHDPLTSREGNFSIVDLRENGTYKLQDVKYTDEETNDKNYTSLDDCRKRLYNLEDAEARIIIVPEGSSSYNDDFLNVLCSVFHIEAALLWSLIRSSSCWTSQLSGQLEARQPEALRNRKILTPYKAPALAAIGPVHLLKVEFAQPVLDLPDTESLEIVLAFVRWLPRQVPSLVVAEHRVEGAFSAVQQNLESQGPLQNLPKYMRDWARNGMFNMSLAIALESQDSARIMESTATEHTVNAAQPCLAACIYLHLAFARYCATRHDGLFGIWGSKKILNATDERLRADWCGLPTDWTYLCDSLVEFKRAMKVAQKFGELTSVGTSGNDHLTRLFDEFEAELDEIQMLKDRTSERLALEASRSSLQASTASIEMARESVLDSKRTRQLTILAFVFVPLSLATSIFGMNVQQINSTGTQIWVFIIVAVILSLVAFATLMIVGTANTARENWRIRRHVTNELYDSKSQAAKTLLISRRWRDRKPSNVLYLMTNGRYGRGLLGQQDAIPGFWNRWWEYGKGFAVEIGYLAGLKRVNSGSSNIEP